MWLLKKQWFLYCHNNKGNKKLLLYIKIYIDKQFQKKISLFLKFYNKYNVKCFISYRTDWNMSKFFKNYNIFKTWFFFNYLSFLQNVSECLDLIWKDSFTWSTHKILLW